MDNLGDSVNKLKLSAGQNLIPAVAKGADALALLIDSSEAFRRENPLGFVIEQLENYSQNAIDAREDTKTFREAIKDARNPLKELETAASNATVAIVNADTAWKNLTTSLDQEVALDEAKTKLGELEAAAAKAFSTGNQQDIDDYEAKLATFAGVLAGISGTMDGISSKEILFKFKTQGSAAALEYASYLARGAEYGGLSPEDALGLAGISTLPRRAMGGPVMGGSSYLVGERGAEIFTPSSSGNITPNSALGGSANITVNVNGGDPNSIVRALQDYVRQSGPVPLNTRAM